MELMMLMEWSSLIYILPFGTGLIFFFLSALGMGEHDAGHEISAGNHPSDYSHEAAREHASG